MSATILDRHAGSPAAGGGRSDTATAWLVCGVDIAHAARGSVSERTNALRRIRRAMERERWKGPMAYDLDRHLALKRCRDRLIEAIATSAVADDGA